MLRGAEALAKNVRTIRTKSLYEKVEQTLRPQRATLLEAFRLWAPEIAEVPKINPFGEPQVVHVEAALKKEKVDEVQGLMRSALTRL